MAKPRPWLTFDRFLLVAGLLAGLLIAAGPLLRECWARYTWTPLPCYRFPDKPQFVFRLHGKSWISARPNMWFVPHADAVPTMVSVPSDNDTCFVDGNNPPIAVLRLDAAQHLSEGFGNFAAGGLVVGATWVFVLASAVRAKRAASAPPPLRS